MSDKDQFTFEDEDDNPETGVSKKTEPQESDSFDGEVFFDTEEDPPGRSLGDQTGPEASEKGKEEFFFDTEDEDSESTKVEGYSHAEPDAEEVGFAVDEDLFGDNLNAGFPDEEQAIDDPVDYAPEPKVKSGAGSKNRTLLMVLLLVFVAAGGAYYFMGLGSSTPSVPTVQVPVEKPVKTVAVPPPPADKAPAEQAASARDKPVTVAVPPPPAPIDAKADVKPVVAENTPAPAGESKPAAAKQPEVNAASPGAKPGAVSVSVPAPAPVPVPVPVPAPVPAQQATSDAAEAASAGAPEPPAVKTVAAPEPAAPKSAAAKPEEAPEPVAVPEQVADGAYELDAGSYLLESNRNALVAKIKKLGYEPSVTPVEARVDMTRLRVGTYSKEDVQASLAFARQIEPGSYSVPAGDGYVIYAGTFLKTDNLKKIKERFLAEGIQVKSEPVEVVRTLSRIRFGSFATEEDAAAVAGIVAEDGLKAVVVKAR